MKKRTGDDVMNMCSYGTSTKAYVGICVYKCVIGRVCNLCVDGGRGGGACRSMIHQYPSEGRSKGLGEEKKGGGAGRPKG